MKRKYKRRRKEAFVTERKRSNNYIAVYKNGYYGETVTFSFIFLKKRFLLSNRGDGSEEKWWSFLER